MNKNVFNYLNDKAHDAMDYIRAKAEAAGAYLEDHASDIKDGFVKGTATVLTVASLLGGMTGCVMQGNPQQGIQMQGAPQSTQPVDPNAPSKSESGLFFGEQYKEEDLPPVINHRTEEEIAQTGLTAQDVLNAYDQLAIDIARAFTTHDAYISLPEETRNKVVAEFESLSPWSFYYGDPISGKTLTVNAPFYALDPNFEAKQPWQRYKGDFSDIFPAYSTTLTFKAYIDGVAFTQKLYNVGVEQTQMETLLKLLNQESFYLDDTTLKNITDTPESFERFLFSDVYTPITITKDLIKGASPEQLEGLYNILSSIRSITLNQSLPQSTTDLEMQN